MSRYITMVSGVQVFLRRLIFVAAVSQLMATQVLAQQPAFMTVAQRERLDAIASQDVPDAAPGIATGVVMDGKVVFEKCIGLANLPDMEPITKSSRFNIASNGKQFTALSVLLLESEGKLSLEDDVRKFFPELYPNISTPITLEHLLTHTSGIRDVYDLWSLQGLTWWEHEFDNADALELLHRQEELNFDPGSDYMYSNSNYILLAEIVTRASGTSFVDFTNEMFRNLNMPDTSFVSDHTKIREPIAKPYFNFDTWTGYEWIWNVQGDGNAFSTLADQLQWECILQGAGQTSIDRQLIDQSQQLVRSELTRGYGYGLEFGDYRGLKTKSHAGGTGAWKAYTVRFPDEHLAIVTLTNSGKTDPVFQSRQMADTILDLDSDSTSFAISPAQIGDHVSDEEILGRYLTDTSFVFQFVQSEGNLYLRREGRGDVLLEREAANVFHQKLDPAFKQEFKRNEDGEMEVTAYYPTHAPYTLVRPESDWTGYDFRSLNGTFTNSETDVTFQIAHVEETRYQVSVGEQQWDATLVTPDKLIAAGYTIEWAESSQAPTVLRLGGNRIQKVKFVRQD